jgi:hypothetical protein
MNNNKTQPLIPKWTEQLTEDEIRIYDNQTNAMLNAMLKKHKEKYPDFLRHLTSELYELLGESGKPALSCQSTLLNVREAILTKDFSNIKEHELRGLKEMADFFVSIQCEPGLMPLMVLMRINNDCYYTNNQIQEIAVEEYEVNVEEILSGIDHTEHLGSNSY